MQKTKLMEFRVGIFVLLGMVALAFLAYKVSNLSESINSDSYEVKAKFSNIGGLKARSPVNIAGVKIGEVQAVFYDQEQYEAVVILKIDSRYNKLPEDTSASIFTAGLLGEQYVGLDPGGSDIFLEAGGEITLTQSAIILEKVIGEFLFSQVSSDSD